MNDFREQISPDNFIEAVVLLLLAAFLVVEVFMPLLKVVLVAAVGVAVYFAIKNPEQVKIKAANLVEYIKSAR
jgi:uncharacterized membrane protein